MFVIAVSTHRRASLLAIAVAMVVISIGVLSPRSQVMEGPLNPLVAPEALTFVAARRAAATVFADFVALSEAEVIGDLTGVHVTAMAEHMALFDRPRHPAMIVALAEGQSVTSLRRHWHLRTSELEALNPGVNLATAEAGTEFTVWRFDPENPGRSRLRPNRGTLENGELMPEGEGWVIKDPELAFGAEQTITALILSMRSVMAHYPGGQDMLIADISDQNGGPLSPHRSHESGRDVDTTYYERSTEEPTFSRCRTNELDEKRTWELIRTMVTQHDVVYIFMYRRLQAQLFEYAESIGEHPAFLDEVFEYTPEGHQNSGAIIREARGHHDHMHIRYACTSDDIRCHSASY